MAKVIRFYRAGGPEVLVLEDVEVGKPGPGEARVRHKAVGLNFVDIYIRKGLYPVPLPSGLSAQQTGSLSARTRATLRLATSAPAQARPRPWLQPLSGPT
jgi:hypothetical protein